jgi:hypothetical protein
MHDFPCRNLCLFIAQQGRSVLPDPTRLEAMLKEACPDNQAEVNVLVKALKVNVPAAILAGDKFPMMLALDFEAEGIDEEAEQKSLQNLLN